MKNIEDYDDIMWENLFEFVFPDEKNLSRKEVQSELLKLDIDIRPAWDKIQMALEYSKEAERARKDLEFAKRKRTTTLAKFKNIQVPSIQSIRGQIIKLIQVRLTDPQKLVYCRKLESAASDNDLKALLEDLLRLDELSKDSDDVET